MLTLTWAISGRQVTWLWINPRDDDEHRFVTSADCSLRPTLDAERALSVSLTLLRCSDEAKFESKFEKLQK